MKNLNKGFVWLPVLIAVVVGVVLIGGGAYYFMHQQTNTTAPTQGTSTQNQNNMPTVAQNTSPKKWSAYRNSKANYEIQYPASARIDATDSSCVSIKTDFGMVLINAGSNDPCGPTGTGANDVQVKDVVTIDGKNYKSSGFKSPDDSSGFVSFIFDKKVSVGYFPNSTNNPINDGQFQQNMSAMREVFATLQSITPVPEYESGQIPTKAPSITSVGTQPINPGDTVIVYGANFNLYSRISFDGSTDPYVTTTYPKILSASSLSFVAPSTGVGSHTIQIIDSSGAVSPSNKLSLNISNTNNTPFINSGLVSGTQISNSVPVTLKGVNFSSHSELIITGAGYNTKVANPLSVSSDGTELVFTLPLPAYPDVTTANVQVENTDTYKSSNTVIINLR